MKHEEIEIQLWEYLDGACNEADRQRIASLISSDVAWAQKYRELSAVHTGLSSGLEIEQPSMRFTKNVMEAVAATHISPATKKYINPRIIRGIAAFFILTIASLIGYAIATANWNESGGQTDSKLNFSMHDLFNGTTFTAMMLASVILALVLLDTLLRHKRSHN